MRIAFLIPHCFRGDDSTSLHGSSWAAARGLRAQTVDRAIFQLHSLWGRRHSALDGKTLQRFPGGNPHAFDFDVFVFTTRGLHLVDMLRTKRLFTHIQTEADPPFLGFECAKWIRDHRGQYDYFFYMEDDLLIHDPLFVRKIHGFNQKVGATNPRALLQPQRYEISLAAGDPRVINDIDRLYIDYRNPDITVPDAPPLEIDFFGMTIAFEPAPNPHAGCYMLSNAQANYVVNHPDFLKHIMFDAPGDTAATAFIAQALTVYKPALSSLSFLEIQHGHQVCLRMD